MPTNYPGGPMREYAMTLLYPQAEDAEEGIFAATEHAYCRDEQWVPALPKRERDGAIPSWRKAGLPTKRSPARL